MSRPTIAVHCPRTRALCDVCQEPAVVRFEGPPENPACDPRMGGTSSNRCAAHGDNDALASWSMDVTSRYPAPRLGRVSKLVVCDAEMLLEVNIDSAVQGDFVGVFLDEDVPRECPEGHLFTAAELAYLDGSAAWLLDQYIGSDQIIRDVEERTAAKLIPSKP